jgi:hypothetical protein
MTCLGERRHGLFDDIFRWAEANDIGSFETSEAAAIII